MGSPQTTADRATTRGKFKRRCALCWGSYYYTHKTTIAFDWHDRACERDVRLRELSVICRPCFDHNVDRNPFFAKLAVPMAISTKLVKCHRCKGTGLVDNPVPVGPLPTRTLRHKKSKSQCTWCKGSKKEAE